MARNDLKEFSYSEQLVTAADDDLCRDIKLEVTLEDIIIEVDDGGPMKRVYLTDEQFNKAVGIVQRARAARLVATGNPATTTNQKD